MLLAVFLHSALEYLAWNSLGQNSVPVQCTEHSIQYTVHSLQLTLCSISHLTSRNLSGCHEILMNIAQYDFQYCPVRFSVLPSPFFSEICCLFRLVKWKILPILPSWKLSGVGILANKALGPRASGFISQYSHSTQFPTGKYRYNINSNYSV